MLIYIESLKGEYMSLKKELEDKKIETVLQHIIDKSNKKIQITKEDETVYYICQILGVMGNYNNPMEILNLLSPNTKEAFIEINAIKYAEVFDKAYKQIEDENNKIKGMFRYFKLKKVVTPIIKDLYNKIDFLNKESDLVSNHLLPYIIKNYANLFVED